MRVLSLLLLLCPLLTGTAHAQGLDDLVLANVNGEDITRRQLVGRLLDYHGAESLEKLVTRQILEQAAKRHGVSVTAEEVKQKHTEVLSRFRSDEDYRKFLQSSKLKESQHREEIHHTLLAQKVVLKEQPITDADLEQYDLRIIVAADKATAEKWIQDLVKGAEFRQVAATRNGDVNLRKAAGHLQPFLAIQMPELARAVDEQKLKPLEFTKKPVGLSNGSWAIVRLERMIPVSLGASAVERERLTAAVLTQRISAWFQKNRAKATVQKLPLDQPNVAMVNSEPVKRETLVNWLLEYKGEEALDQMVNRTLLLQAARKVSLSPTDADVEKQLAELRARFKTPQELQEFIGKANLSEKQFLDEARYNFLMEKVALREAPITEDDLTRYDVRMIVCPDRNTALEWVKELDNGGDFKQIARTRSADPQGRQSEGRFNPFLRIEMLDIWRALNAQALKPGMYTKDPVLLTDGTWALLKLEGLQGVASASKEEREKRTKAVRDYRVNQWLVQTRSTAKVAYPVPLTAVIARSAEK